MIPAVARSVAPPRMRRGGELTPALAVALAVAVFHLVLSGRYGFHRDELYHLAAGRHPALGYVDQPAVVPLLARAITEVVGEHLWALRAVAGAAHAAVVVLGALIARQLGGGRRALLLAALATATMPLLVAAGSLFGTVVFDQVWWSVALLLVVRLLGGADPRWWIGVGAVAGLGLETKWTIALLGIGLAVGFAAVPEARRHLTGPWPWLGAALALVVWSPNLVWQALNDWPTLEFVRNNNADVRAGDGRLGFVALQAGMVGPLALPLVGAGLVRLWRSRTWRALVVATAAVAAVLLVAGGKAYYLGPLWVLAAGAGAVAAEAWIDAEPRLRRRRVSSGSGDDQHWAPAGVMPAGWVGPAPAESAGFAPVGSVGPAPVGSAGAVPGVSAGVAPSVPATVAAAEGERQAPAARRRWRLAVAALVVNGLVPLAAVAPVAPVGVYARVFQSGGELGEQVGWPEMVDLVASVRNVLPEDQRADARVITASYGEAAAIDLYGPDRGVPRGTALSGHNSYADWWPDGEPMGTVITVRYDRSAIEPHCDAMGPVAVVPRTQGVDNEVAGTPIHVCRGLRIPPDELRDALRHAE